MTNAKEASLDTIFRAIADPTRRRILQLLAVNALTVGGICEQFSLTQPAISQHMKVLREAGLVEAQSEWRHRIYHCKPNALQSVMQWLRIFEDFWDDALDRLDAAIESKEGEDDGH